MVQRIAQHNHLISRLTLIIKPYLESLSFSFYLNEEVEVELFANSSWNILLYYTVLLQSVSQLPQVITRKKPCLLQSLHYICSSKDGAEKIILSFY